MIQLANERLGSALRKMPKKAPAVHKAVQAALQFPVPTYLQNATSNIQLFSNPPAPSHQDVETACAAIRALMTTGGKRAMSRTQLQVWVDDHEDYAAFLSC
jgi:hypothetical protein